MKTKILTTLLIIVIATISSEVYAQSGLEIMKKVNLRNEGKTLAQDVEIEMTDRRGKTQNRVLRFFRKDFTGERKSAIFYTSPANVKGTGFLTFDYQNAEKEDNQWLYLPALRKTRRISTANRGDYFLGTDLTYEDVKLGTKVGINDYSFKTRSESAINGKKVIQIEGTPLNEKIAKELGYGKVLFSIDTQILIPLKIEYWDIAGNPLKVVEFKEIKKVQNIWTVQVIEARNLKTNHKTVMYFKGHDYETEPNNDLFTEEALVRGI